MARMRCGPVAEAVRGAETLSYEPAQALVISKAPEEPKTRSAPEERRIPSEKSEIQHLCLALDAMSIITLDTAEMIPQTLYIADNKVSHELAMHAGELKAHQRKQTRSDKRNAAASRNAPHSVVPMNRPPQPQAPTPPRLSANMPHDGNEVAMVDASAVAPARTQLHGDEMDLENPQPSANNVPSGSRPDAPMRWIRRRYRRRPTMYRLHVSLRAIDGYRKDTTAGQPCTVCTSA